MIPLLYSYDLNLLDGQRLKMIIIFKRKKTFVLFVDLKNPMLGNKLFLKNIEGIYSKLLCLLSSP
jgi:hypothetical protein